MSIISEALKKAEQNRNSAIRLSDHTGGMQGFSKSLDGLPVRSQASAGLERQAMPQRPKAAEPRPVSSTARNERPAALGWKRYAPIGSILLSILCVFIVHGYITSEQYAGRLSSTYEKAGSGAIIEVEPYSDMREEIIKSEQLVITLPALSPHDYAKEKFFSSVQLNGIVNDGVETIAILNNEILRVGDDVEQARILDIKSGKVVLSLKGKSFDMLLK